IEPTHGIDRRARVVSLHQVRAADGERHASGGTGAAQQGELSPRFGQDGAEMARGTILPAALNMVERPNDRAIAFHVAQQAAAG
ncbi:MAG TPA: hypothetical protein VL175_18040, partial [Pirellulales bacterium]|nr:hypothetical protein [Pirellulales bacterium]